MILCLLYGVPVGQTFLYIPGETAEFVTISGLFRRYDMSSMIFNLVSIACGLVAILLPIIAVVKAKPAPWLSAFSFAFCAFALLAQILDYDYRVSVEDFSGLLDISGATRTVSVLLVAAVLFFQFLAQLAVRRKQNRPGSSGGQQMISTD